MKDIFHGFYYRLSEQHLTEHLQLAASGLHFFYKKYFIRTTGLKLVKK